MAEDTIVTLLDGNNNTIPMKARKMGSNSFAFYHVQDDRLPGGVLINGVTTANTSVSVAASNLNRVALTVYNTSNTDMRISEDGNAATATSFLLPAGGFAEINTNMQINIFCTVSGKTFSASETSR